MWVFFAKIGKKRGASPGHSQGGGWKASPSPSQGGGWKASPSPSQGGGWILLDGSNLVFRQQAVFISL